MRADKDLKNSVLDKSAGSLKQNGWAGRSMIQKDCVDSTNEEAKRGGDHGAPHGTVYCAKRQTAGKGRRGRNWLSDSAENLYFTILLRPELAPEKITMLTLVMAYAATEGIRVQTGLEPKIKWPNDIVVNNKKVCGILSEMKLDGRKAAYCVIGVGINIGRMTFPEELLDKATSLEAEGADTDALTLLKSILEAFEAVYEIVIRDEDLSSIMDKYNTDLAGRGGMVRVLEPAGEFEGRSLGINPAGELLVEREDGHIQNIYAGEVSVRGLYGYV